MIKRVQVYKVSSMIEYDMEGNDETDLMVKALDAARSDMENPVKRTSPDCRYVAVITGEGGSKAKRGHSKKKGRRRERRGTVR